MINPLLLFYNRGCRRHWLSSLFEWECKKKKKREKEKTRFRCQASQHFKLDRFGFSGNVKPLLLPVICNLGSSTAQLQRNQCHQHSWGGGGKRRLKNKVREEVQWKGSGQNMEVKKKKAPVAAGGAVKRKQRQEVPGWGLKGVGGIQHAYRSCADPEGPFLGPFLFLWDLRGFEKQRTLVFQTEWWIYGL